MITYHHEPTSTSVETETGKVSGPTLWEQIKFRTQYVDTSVTRYDSDVVGPWTSQSIHLRANNDVYARVETRDDGSRYLVVKLDQHDTIFVPIEIAEAIVEAMLDDEAVAEAIHAEEVAS